MPSFFLDVDAAQAERFLSFRLSDEAGRHLAAHQVRLEEQRPALWESIFDSGGYVRRFSEVLRRAAPLPGQPKNLDEVLANIGLFVGEQVLGEAITGAVLEGIEQRSLTIRFADAADSPVAAALLRVPWELASLSSGPNAGKAWLDQNVVVRAVPAEVREAQRALLGADEMLRVLLVYADTPDTPVLGMRRERECLLDVFQTEVMPERLVRADVLCHGVTREVLREAVQSAGGYHIIHWSGHGRHDALSLSADDGEQVLPAAELVELFRAAGGFIPQLFFLSACNSGAAFGPEGFGSLQAYLRNVEAAGGDAEAAGGENAWRERKGFTGTAFELLKAGVPQVIGMRYEVTDGFARGLAAAFYKILLSHRKAHAADAALSMARSELRSRGSEKRFHPVDHATPLFFGGAAFGFDAVKKRSPALDTVRPRPQPLLHGSRDLDRPESLAGRRAELGALGNALRRGDKRAVVVITGPAGIGKTALAAEAIHLWHQGFDWVFGFQAKRPDGLLLDEFCKRLHKRLLIASPAYRGKCTSNALSAVFVDPSEFQEPDERVQLMLDNIVGLMRSERLLVVLDHADANLMKVEGNAPRPCAEPAWERTLAELAGQLRGGGSRLMLTSRFQLSALSSDEQRMEIELGPLRVEESSLLLEEEAEAGGIAFPLSMEDRTLLRGILTASRGHPFLMRRLTMLLASHRDALREALEHLAAHGLSALGTLPELLSKVASPSSSAQAAELKSYLEDIADSGF